MTEVETNLERLILDDEGGGDDTPFTLGSGPLPERRGRPAIVVDPESRRFNEALHRLARGKGYDIGGISHELSVITGLSIEQIRSRVDSVEYEPAPLEAGTGLTTDDLRYLGKLCKNDSDPVVRDFYQRISGGQRTDPDHENPRVSRQRVDGKLISLAIAPSRN